MDIPNYLSFPAGIITQYPQLASQLAGIDQEASITTSLAADGITAGSSASPLYNQSLVQEIQDQQSLIATLSSIAGSNPAAAAWAAWDINALDVQIRQELSSLTADGGSMNITASGSAAGPVDSMGSGNALSGPNLLAIGPFNIENGPNDVEVGPSNTISGGNDVALGNNDTIIGDNARVFGSGLSASTGQTVWGTATNYTVINADGTWSTVVNGSVVIAQANASSDASLMTLESQAVADGFRIAKSYYASLSSQYPAVASSINADMAAGAFGIWNFTNSALPALPMTFTPPGPALSSGLSSGLSSADAAAMASLAANPWGATTSALDMSILSQIAGRDGPSTVLGATAAATLGLISAGVNPTYGFSLLNYEATLPSMTSSSVAFGKLSSQVPENVFPYVCIANAEYNAKDWSALSATLAILATSSDAEVASIASAELLIFNQEGPSATGAGVTSALFWDYEWGQAIPSATIAAIISATGSAVSWTGSTFAFSSTPPPLIVTASGLIPADAAAVSALAATAWWSGTSAAIMTTLSQIAGRDGPNTYLGADARAALAMIAAGADPTYAIGLLKYDAANPIMTSSLGRTDSVSTQDAAYINIANAEYNAGDWSDELATLSILATSSNLEVASIASAELLIAATEGPSATGAGVSGALYLYYEAGLAIPSATTATIATELSSATDSTMVWTGSTFVSSGLSSADAAAVATLSANPWNATNSSLIMTTLSQIVAQDTASTILGADAAAALTLISASQSPAQAIALLLGDAASPNITSHTTTISGFSAQDRANIAIATAEDDAGDRSSFDATLSSLATSSNPIIATIASTGLNPDAAPWDVVDALYYYAIGSVIPGGAADPTFSVAIASLAVELSSATGSTMIWTGSNFVVSAN